MYFLYHIYIKLLIYVFNSDQKIPCYLWGKFAEAIHSFSQQAEEEIVVCLIRFAKIGTYRSNLISFSLDIK